MTNQKLTKRQEEHRQDLVNNLKLYVGYNCPGIMKSFDLLVSKGFAKVADQSEYGKHFITTEFHIIETTVMFIGKGIRPGNHTGEKFIWIVTSEALKRLVDKKAKFEIVY